MTIQELEIQSNELTKRRAQLQSDLEDARKQEEGLKSQAEEELLTGASGKTAHELRECQTRQEVIQSALAKIEQQFQDVQRELAELRRLEEIKPMLELEQVIWKRLDDLRKAILVLENQFSEIKNLVRGFRPATQDGNMLDHKISFIFTTAEPGLRSIREAVEYLLRYRQNDGNS